MWTDGCKKKKKLEQLSNVQWFQHSASADLAFFEADTGMY